MQEEGRPEAVGHVNDAEEIHSDTDYDDIDDSLSDAYDYDYFIDDPSEEDGWGTYSENYWFD